MYIIYCLVLLGFVYTLPALALFPHLICSPKMAFAIPVLSAFIIYVVSSLCITLGLFSTPVVTSIALCLGLIAVLRARKVITTEAFTWTKQDVFLYVFHAAVLLPYFVKLGTHAFDRGDEIYSWNFWAIQHYLLEAIDFSHTGAPYPQLLPKLLAFCYHLLGNVDLQLPVKAMLIVFPWAMLTAVSMSIKQRFVGYFGAYLVLLAYVLGVVGLEQFFNDGYADPLMTAGLITSMVLFWHSQQIKDRPGESFYYAYLAVLCGVACAHTKQPGLLWVMFSLPLLLWFSTPLNQEKTLWRQLSALSVIGGLCWLIGEGQGFHHNDGVLWLSLADRDLMTQLFYSIDKYFIHKPFLFLLMVAALLAACSDKLLRKMVLLFALPSLVCWFLFGAYQLRLGQHLIAFAFFVLVASGYASPFKRFKSKKWLRFLIFCRQKQKHILIGSLGFSFSLSALLFMQWGWLDQPGVSLYEGGRHSLQRYFGKDAERVYTTIYSSPNSLLWVPSRYLYGLFYHHTQLTTPDYSRYRPYTQMALIEELQRKLPDFVFTVSQDIIDGDASRLLVQTIKACPRSFEIFSVADNKFSFVTYKVNKAWLRSDPCLQALAGGSPKNDPIGVAQNF